MNPRKTQTFLSLMLVVSTFMTSTVGQTVSIQNNKAADLPPETGKTAGGNQNTSAFLEDVFVSIAGELNIEGAVHIAKLVRQDLGSAPAVGTQMLTSKMRRAHNLTVAGTQFQWSGGILSNYVPITGTNLIAKYRGVYANGIILSKELSSVTTLSPTMFC